MPKENSALASADPPEVTPFYYVRVPTRLLKRVEKRRKERGQNKGVTVLTMIELYLADRPEVNAP